MALIQLNESLKRKRVIRFDVNSILLSLHVLEKLDVKQWYTLEVNMNCNFKKNEFCDRHDQLKVSIQLLG